MADSQTEPLAAKQVEAASKAFEQEFERFARFGDPSQLADLNLDAAIAEQRAFDEVRTRHLGKKSAFAAAKKLIGRVAPEERPAFGQLVTRIEEKLVALTDAVELNLKNHIEEV